MTKTKLPHGWKSVKLGSIFKERVEANNPDLELLSVTGISGIVPRSTLAGKDNSNPDKSKYLKVCKGDIAYNTMRMWQGVSALSEYEGIVSPAYTVLEANDGVCADYFKYLFKLPSVIFKFYRWSQGLVDDQRSLKYHNFAIINEVIPPLPEQQRIAEILAATDTLIATQERLIASKQKQKRWLMQNLLTGKMRLPGFNGKWEQVRLGDVANTFAGGDVEVETFSKIITDKHKHPVYANALQNDGIYGYTSNPKYKADSVTITARGAIGTSVWRNVDFDAIIRLIVLTPNKRKVHGKYLSYAINQCVVFFLESTGVPQLTIPKVNISKILLPPLPEQVAIAEILTTADKEIELLTKKREQQKLMKKYLMQQLLTGKICAKGAS
jgi:restriction endonuclease S subunit